jgi:hypothetical protein
LCSASLNICKEIGVKFGNEYWYDHIPKSVETSQGKFTILSNQQVQTDRNISNNKPDIIIRDNKKGTRVFIDDVISGDRNVIKKEAENILKYNDLIIEIQHCHARWRRVASTVCSRVEKLFAFSVKVI